MLVGALEIELPQAAEPVEGEEVIEVEKKTKRGVSMVDLKPHVKVENISDEGFVLYLPSGCDFTVNPSLLFDAYEKYNGEEIEKIDIVRSKILCKDGSEFI